MKRFDGPWVEKKLGEVGTFKKGKGISREESHTGSISAVRYGEIYTSHSDYIKSYCSFISEEVGKKSVQISKGEILFACSGETKEEIGKCVAKIDDSIAFAGGDLIIFSPNIEFDPLFLGTRLNLPDIVNQKSKNGQGDAVVHISAEAIKNIYFSFPEDITEQRAIARVLSDMDGLIGSTERLIEKKKAVKNALLHDLLSGKRRLNGFTDTWEERKLGEVCEIRSGGTPKTNDVAFWNGKILWCTPTDITANNDIYISSTARTISELGVTHGANGILPAGTLLVCSRATIGELKIAACPITTNQGFKNLICNEKVNNLFLYYKLQTMKQELISRASGSTFLEISKTKIEIIPFLLPSLPEQHAIAEILSDADNEIVALERKVEKLRSVKAGMMGKLLTGEIRLPSEV